MNLRILTEAEEEIEEARKYLNRQSHGLGQRFLDDLAARLAAIAHDPLRFSKLETLPDDSPFRRALLHVFRYAVIFEIIDDTAIVVAVAVCRLIATAAQRASVSGEGRCDYREAINAKDT